MSTGLAVSVASFHLFDGIKAVPLGMDRCKLRSLWQYKLVERVVGGLKGPVDGLRIVALASCKNLEEVQAGRAIPTQ